MTDRSKIKEALLRVVIEAASQYGTLDQEDRDMLVRYHMGQITREQLDAFTAAKAKRIQDQINNPQ